MLIWKLCVASTPWAMPGTRCEESCRTLNAGTEAERPSSTQLPQFLET